jgi:hypothetical protein
MASYHKGCAINSIATNDKFQPSFYNKENKTTIFSCGILDSKELQNRCGLIALPLRTQIIGFTKE